MEFIGYDFAKQYGFTVHHYSADRSSVCYMNMDNGIVLDIYKNLYDDKLVGKLSFNYNFLTVSTGDFSIPNKNFELFLKKVQEAHARLNY